MPKTQFLPKQFEMEYRLFAGGLNETENEINDNELSLTENVYPRTKSIKAVEGYEKYNNEQLGYNVTAMFTYINNTNDSFVMFVSGNEIRLLASDSTKLIFTLPNPVSQAQFIQTEETLLLATDDFNWELIYDISAPYFNVRKLSLTTPTTFNPNLTEVNIGSGNLSKDKKYQYAYTKVLIEDNVLIKESGLSPISEITLTKNSDVNLNFIKDLSDNQTTHFYIYRTTGGTAEEPTTDLHFLQSITNTTQVFTDNISDEILMVETDLADTSGFEALPSSGQIEVVDKRIYMVDVDNPNTLLFTHNLADSTKWKYLYNPAGQNLYSSSTGIYSVTGKAVTSNGQPINKIKRIGKDLYIATTNRLYYIRNNNPESGLYEIPETMGCKSKYGMVEKDGKLLVQTYEVDRRGLRYVDGLSYGNDLTNEQLETTFDDIVDFSKNIMVETSNNLFIFYNDDTTKNYNNKALILIFNKENVQGWTKLINIIGDIATVTGDDELIVFDNNSKYFYKLNSGYTRDGEKIKSKFRLKAISNKAGDVVEIGTISIYGKNLNNLKCNLIIDSGSKSQFEVVKKEQYPDDWQTTKWNKSEKDNGSSGYFKDSEIECYEVNFITNIYGTSIIPEFEIKYDTEWEIYKICVSGIIRRFR